MYTHPWPKAKQIYTTLGQRPSKVGLVGSLNGLEGSPNDLVGSLNGLVPSPNGLV